MSQSKKAETIRSEERLNLYRRNNKAANRWAAGSVTGTEQDNL